MEFLKTIMAFWDFSQNLDRSFWHGKFTAEKVYLWVLKIHSITEKNNLSEHYILCISKLNWIAPPRYFRTTCHEQMCFQGLFVLVLFECIYIFSGFVPVALLFAPFDLNLCIFLHNFCYNNHSPRHQNFALFQCVATLSFGGSRLLW